MNLALRCAMIALLVAGVGAASAGRPNRTAAGSRPIVLAAAAAAGD